MNDASICARWREHHWDCGLLDSLIDPDYFHPPKPGTGAPIGRVTAFHHTMPPEGYQFTREGVGKHWTRVA